jgi:hypothetical protein
MGKVKGLIPMSTSTSHFKSKSKMLFGMLVTLAITTILYFKEDFIILKDFAFRDPMEMKARTKAGNKTLFNFNVHEDDRIVANVSRIGKNESHSGGKIVELKSPVNKQSKQEEQQSNSNQQLDQPPAVDPIPDAPGVALSLPSRNVTVADVASPFDVPSDVSTINNSNNHPPPARRVFVASHRRSGTHMTMNLLLNHFRTEENALQVQKLNHLAVDDQLTCSCLMAMLSDDNYIVYAEREFVSVLQSMYYYMRNFKKNPYFPKTTSLQAFLAMDDLLLDIAWMWHHTSHTWRALAKVRPDRVLMVRFEEMHDPTSAQMDAISSFLGLSQKKQAGNKKNGVGVGLGKGLAQPPEEVGKRASWALATIQPDKLRVWFGKDIFGVVPLNVTRSACDGSQDANFTTCPTVWDYGYNHMLLAQKMREEEQETKRLKRKQGKAATVNK